MSGFLRDFFFIAGDEDFFESARFAGPAAAVFVRDATRAAAGFRAGPAGRVTTMMSKNPLVAESILPMKPGFRISLEQNVILWKTEPIPPGISTARPHRAEAIRRAPDENLVFRRNCGAWRKPTSAASRCQGIFSYLYT